MSIGRQQVPPAFLEVIEREIDVYQQNPDIREEEGLPDTNDIPIEDRSRWLKIPEVVCVFVDMVGSTRLSANQHDHSTAGVYQLFTETAVRLLSAFEAPYIDVRGDGAFALFDKGQEYRALAAAVTFKTFAEEEFSTKVSARTGIEVGAHIGIDQKTLLVRKVGLKRAGGRTDRQNEVWAGKPVNMAAKLASLTSPKQLMVSDRFYRRIGHELVRKSCPCNGGKTGLWERQDLWDDDRFDFEYCHRLDSIWCRTHGREYCEGILALSD